MAVTTLDSTARKQVGKPRKRVSKPPEIRREEFLDACEELCKEYSFDALSVEMIAAKVGVAKGTFYLYYSSKEDLLEQLLVRYSDWLMGKVAQDLAASKGKTALERLRVFWIGAANYKMEANAAAFADYLFDPKQTTIRNRMMEIWTQVYTTEVREIVIAGAQDGSFDVIDPEMVCDILISIWFDAATRMWTRVRKLSGPEFVQAFALGTREICQTQERILGAAPGSFQMPHMEQIEAILEDFDSKREQGKKS